MASVATFLKDPNAVLDYTLDWNIWLGTDTISTGVWTVPAGITKGAETTTTTTTKVILSSGTAGTSYDVACRIVTVGGLTEDRTITIQVQER